MNTRNTNRITFCPGPGAKLQEWSTYQNEFFGRDEYLNSVIVKTNENLEGKIKEVKIVSGNQNTLYGEIIHKKETEFAA